MPMIMMSADLLGDIHKYEGEWDTDFPTLDIAYTAGHRFTFVHLDQFLNWCTPETIVALLAERTKFFGGEVPRPRRAIIT